jgi:hypothetical protein
MVVAEGEQPGFRWRLVIRRAKLPSGQHELIALGQSICSERLRTVKVPGGTETIPGGSCF